jgi:hypothetical protein
MDRLASVVLKTQVVLTTSTCGGSLVIRRLIFKNLIKIAAARPAALVVGAFVGQTGGLAGMLSPADTAFFTYHKYSVLVTSDGATVRYACMFIDDMLQGAGCGLASNNPTERSWIAASAGSNAGTATENSDFNVQYIRIWSCAEWRNSNCNGSTLYNNKGLIFWH